jgi:hypothetical protein
MNTGTSDLNKAKKWAQANADVTGKPRWIFIPPNYTTYWISKTEIKGGHKIEPSMRVGRHD